MRRLLSPVALVFGLLFSVSLVSAQQYVCSDLGAVPVDTLSVSYTPNGEAPIALKAAKTATEDWEILVLRTGSGTSSLSIPVESIGISGSGADEIDSVSAFELLALIDQVSVERALASGHIATPAPGNWTSVHVYHSGCVERVGRGAQTRFVAGPHGCASKTFVVATPYAGGTPNVMAVGANGPVCNGFESTWQNVSVLLSMSSVE